uniref:Geranylgeranyl transferase type-2 subunit alpha n=1 Tax=Albugo laibachii Nc14 TaxID=890382 RepID=F0W4K2_9STRA|nr:geranylgeranyl transferase type2 subunit alpha putat [Albugo laibachii Nc14]|eukprot:CCA16035.1 geranylgeranyl transferase type2 subunit alpha putat [Albugo laibachii Nc14]
MHGRVKSVERAIDEKKTEDDRVEDLNKVRMYKDIVSKVLRLKKESVYDAQVALPLTRHLLLLNQEFHIVWGYRREIISHILEKEESTDTSNLELGKEELKLTFEALQRNPKSYAAWFHRQWVLDKNLVENVQKEILLCEKLLDLDERNFHCWNYRRYVAKKLGMGAEEELQFSTIKIEQNFSNYSALHHRSISLPVPLTKDIILEEINLVQQAVFTEPDDQSVWFYYRWLIQNAVDLENNETVSESCQLHSFIHSQITWVRELYVMEASAKWVIVTLADLYGRLCIYTTNGDDIQETREKCRALYRKLSDHIDQDHKHYYEYRIKQFAT